MKRLRAYALITLVCTLSAGCESLLVQHHVIFVPLDASIWAAELQRPQSPLEIIIENTQNDQWAKLEYSEHITGEIGFYPSPLQLLRPTLEAYGGRLAEYFRPDAPTLAISVTIRDFKVLLNPVYEETKFAVMLQYELATGDSVRLVTAIGSAESEKRWHRAAYRDAMHSAIGSAIGQSRLHISSALESTTP